MGCRWDREVNTAERCYRATVVWRAFRSGVLIGLAYWVNPPNTGWFVDAACHPVVLVMPCRRQLPGGTIQKTTSRNLSDTAPPFTEAIASTLPLPQLRHVYLYPANEFVRWLHLKC